jgi:hypothetical protein
MTAPEWKSFIRQNAVGAIIALASILIAAAMVAFSENAIVTNIGFFALLTIGVSSIALRIVKARHMNKANVGIAWVPGPIRMGRNRR